MIKYFNMTNIYRDIATQVLILEDKLKKPLPLDEHNKIKQEISSLMERWDYITEKRNDTKGGTK